MIVNSCGGFSRLSNCFDSDHRESPKTLESSDNIYKTVDVLFQLTPCDFASSYQRIDGRCNNIKNPSWGSADIPFSRLASPSYSQNFGPRGSGLGDDLPNVRVVAGAFPERDNPDERVSSMVMQFGQFLDHDISATSFPEKRCCLNPGRPECFNINVPESDPSFPMRKNTSMSCIDFARSRPACGQPGREQVNTITAFIDCSNIYGSEEDLGSDLRTRVGGRLVESDKRPGHLPTKEQLRQTSDHLGGVMILESTTPYYDSLA